MAAQGSGGKEVGKLEQSNPVPLAAAKGSWAGFGDIVAAAAVEGVLELLEKAIGQAALTLARREPAESACQRGARGCYCPRTAARFLQRRPRNREG